MLPQITFGIALAASAFAGWLLSGVYKSEAGAPEMLEFSKSAAASFLDVLKRQALVLGAAALAAAALVYFLLAFFSSKGQAGAVQAGFAFLAGVFSQGLAGFAAARIFFIGVLRTAAAAKRSGAAAFTLALRAAGAASIITLAFSLTGLAALFLLTGGWGDVRSAPLKIAAFCFGSAFAALFARLAGGSSLEAARASAVGSPDSAVLAGSGARDALSLGADIFDSAAAGNLAAMALGAALWPLYGSKAVFFPLFAAAWGLASCAAGIMSAGSSGEGESGNVDALDKGFAAAGVTALAGLFLGCALGLDGNMWLFMASVIGVVSAGLFSFAARYYGGYRHRPARMVANAASGGAAAALIRALSSGFESAAPPAALAAAAVTGSYYCGVRGLEYCCVSGGFTERICGLYGVAAGAAGMLSVSGYVLSLGVFGAISGGARAINSATHHEELLAITAADLAASGRTALAAAGGYAGGAAILASVLLFSAYMVRTSALTGRPFETVNFAGAEGFSGGLLGAMLVFVFCAFCLRAGSASTPAELSKAGQAGGGLKQLAIPAALAMALPLSAALIFRHSDLGPEVLSAMVVSVVVSGALMSAFIRNTAAALENSLFFMEATNSNPGGGSYKAALEGCSAGIALRSTAAPALNVLIKFLPAMALALAELFI
jgi:K(+)-stimulated pyrophosphate-energized sodium pump